MPRINQWTATVEDFEYAIQTIEEVMGVRLCKTCAVASNHYQFYYSDSKTGADGFTMSAFQLLTYAKDIDALHALRILFHGQRK